MSDIATTRTLHVTKLSLPMCVCTCCVCASACEPECNYDRLLSKRGTVGASKHAIQDDGGLG